MWIVDSLTLTIEGSDFKTQEYKDFFVATKRLLLDTAVYRTKQYVTGEDGREAYLRTLMLDSKLNLNTCDAKDLALVESFVHAWTASESGDIDYESAASIAMRKGVRLYIHRSCRRSFTASERGFMGLVPPTARPGDKICIVQGTKFPYILRETETPGTMILVGVAYVHGIMYDMVEENSIRPDKKYLVPTERVIMKVV